MSTYLRPKRPTKGRIQYRYIRYFIPIGKDNDGKLKYKDISESLGPASLITKQMALEVLAEKKKLIRLKKYDKLIIKIPTLGEFAEDYMAYKREIQQKRPSSSKRDASAIAHLIPFFGANTRLSEISVRDIDQYKAFRLKTVQASTLNRELQTLRNMLYQAKKWKQFIDDNPVKEAGLLDEPWKKRRILSYDQQERLLEASPPQLLPLILTALNTGLRITEIIHLKKDSVDLTNEIITLESSEQKGKRVSHIPLNETMVTLLRESMEKSETEYVFQHTKHSYYKTYTSVKNTFKKACDRAQIEGISFHSLRHTFATRALEEHADIGAVSEILRHRDLKTTKRYLHPGGSLKDVVRKVEVADPGKKSGTESGQSKAKAGQDL